MSRAEADKWEKRYREGRYSGRAEPSEFVAEWARRIKTGRALDLACGRGRHAIHLAGLGFEVEAVDIAAAALEQGRAAADAAGVTVNWIQADPGQGGRRRGGRNGQLDSGGSRRFHYRGNPL